MLPEGAPGQMDPAHAARVPSASRARLRKRIFAIWSDPAPNRRDKRKTRFMFLPFMC